MSTAKRHDDQWAARLSAVGQAISRYGLALTLAWIGFGKYIKMEARVLIEHSPLMSWVYDVFSANTVARGFGNPGDRRRDPDRHPPGLGAAVGDRQRDWRSCCSAGR